MFTVKFYLLFDNYNEQIHTYNNDVKQNKK